jgi:hypothetical protein
MDTPIARLGLSIRRGALASAIADVNRDLAAAGIRMRPRYYLSNEYGCVERTCNVGVLWTDAIDQIPALWTRYRSHVHPPALIRRILRHEAGHAFCYVHRLYRRPAFRRTFGVRGHFFRTYPDGGWTPGPADHEALRRGHVVNLRCRKHPDEDFAITFQTWLDPESRWREVYAGVVRRKFEYVEAAVRRYGPRPVISDPEDLDVPIRELTMTPSRWFAR